MNYMVKTWEKNDKVLCTAKLPLFSRFQETYQDTLNLVGNSHLTNYWPQGEFGSSPLCSPLSRALAGLLSQRVVTFKPFVLISFFLTSQAAALSFEQHNYSQSNYWKLRKTPHHSFLPGRAIFSRAHGWPQINHWVWQCCLLHL